MQTRILASIVGGLAGLAATTWVNDSLGISLGFAFAVCGVVGVALGYVVSMLFDVFTASSQHIIK